MKRFFIAAVVLIAIPAFAAESTAPPASQPTTAPAFAPGLAVSIYKLPRVPKRVRKLLPGQVPDGVSTLTSLKAERADLHGLDNNIQAEITGEFLADVGGDYAFEAESDDGLELYLDGERVLADHWVNGSAPPTVATVSLTPGWHPIRVGFYQGDGGVGFNIRVKPTHTDAFIDVPAAALRYDQHALDAARASVGKSDEDASAKPWRAVYKSQAFGEVSEDESELFVELLEGPTGVSKAAREEWRKLAEATGYAKLPYWQQTMVLSGFLHGWLYGQTSRDFPGGDRAPFTLSEPERLEHFRGWNGADRSGFKHVMTIDGRTLEIFTPAADSPERDNASKAIAGLPHYLRQLVRTINVEPYGTTSEFNGGGDGIWIRLKGPASLKTLDSVFAHEAGHCLMSRTNCYDAWLGAIAKDLLSVSQYGRRNPSEDFADTVRLYVAANGDADQIRSLRALYPNRMKLLETLVKQVE